MSAEALRSIRSSLERWTPLGHNLLGHNDLERNDRERNDRRRVLPLGIPALDAVLPQGGLAHGSVTELQVRGASGAATSFALCVCRAAQFRSGAGQLLSGQPLPGQPLPGQPLPGQPSIGQLSRSPYPQHSRGQHSLGQWCAYIDPSATLFAPGVARLGVDLERLLMVQPGADAVSRVAVRIAEANIASVLVIDLSGAVGRLSLDDSSWQRTVRRLALAVKSTATNVLLLTRAEQFKSLPLPTFLRLEFTRSSSESFEIRVGKERTGRISAPQSVALSAFDPVNFDPGSFDSGAHSGSSPERWEDAGRRVS
jgi:hypothetical protein